MRKLVIGALAVMVLAIAAVAQAATQQTFKQTFVTSKNKTATKPGQSVGTSFAVSSSDPENTSKQGQPDPARQLDITFPKGASIDTKAVPQCSATDQEFQSEGKAACNKRTQIGTGTGTANVGVNGFTNVPIDIVAFNRKGGLIVFAKPSIDKPIVLRPRLVGTASKGLHLVTNIPPTNTPLGEASITSFSLKTTPKSSGSGSKRRHFIKTPGKCPSSKNWQFSARFTYKSIPSKVLKSDSPCKR